MKHVMDTKDVVVKFATVQRAIRYVLDTLLPPIKERKPIGFHA